MRTGRVGPETEMEEVATRVPARDRHVRADHDRDTDHVLAPASQPTDGVVHDLGVRWQREPLPQLPDEVREVLGPVRPREAEPRGGEVACADAGRDERRVRRGDDLVDRRRRPGRVVDVSAPAAPRAEHGAVPGDDERHGLRVAGVDAEEEPAHATSRSGRWSRCAAASAS
jgi:hypothetical protein